jgi:hypothetical protein
MVPDMDLNALYKDGFLAGPKDTEESFEKRIFGLHSFFKTPLVIKKISKDPLPLSAISPSFPFFRSSKKLPFWFGAMTWICEVEKGVKIPLLQLPKKKRFSWTSEEELIAHEKVHALRCAFSEARFEEILAYRTSPSHFRRFLGPLFQKPIESYFFLFSSFLTIFYPLAPFFLFILLFIRLAINQRTFHKALNELSKEVVNSEEVIQLFTDKEISLTAKGKFLKIEKNSLRWKQIQLTMERSIDI